MSATVEEWRTVPGASNYMISDWGNLQGRLWSSHRPKWTPRKVYRAKNGYLYTQLKKDDGKKWQPFLHCLVMLVFVGKRGDGFEVCHGDGNKENCRLENLRYGTVGENTEDKAKHGTILHGSQIETYRIDLRDKRDYILALYTEFHNRMPGEKIGKSASNLAKELKVSRQTIMNVINPKKSRAKYVHVIP